MNFTSSPFERMMKEVPHPGWDNDDPCKGCRYYKECKGKKKVPEEVPALDRGAPALAIVARSPEWTPGS